MSESTNNEAAKTTTADWMSVFDLNETTVLEPTVELSPATKKVATVAALVAVGFVIGSNMG